MVDTSAIMKEQQLSGELLGKITNSARGFFTLEILEERYVDA